MVSMLSRDFRASSVFVPTLVPAHQRPCEKERHALHSRRGPFHQSDHRRALAGGSLVTIPSASTSSSMIRSCPPWACRNQKSERICRQLLEAMQRRAGDYRNPVEIITDLYESGEQSVTLIDPEFHHNLYAACLRGIKLSSRRAFFTCSRRACLPFPIAYRRSSNTVLPCHF